MPPSYLSGVRPDPVGGVEVREVSFHPVKADAPQGGGVEVNFNHIPGVAGAREVRHEVGMATLSCFARKL